MQLGFIGAGTVAQAIARHAVRTGSDVVLSNSRGPASLAEVVEALGASARAGTPDEAAASDVVVLAVPWPAVPDALATVSDWTGRTLIDATNQFDANGAAVHLGDDTGSELVARHAPGADVVKAFNTLYGREMAADPRREGGRLLLFYAGDREPAWQRVHDLADGFGFAPLRIGGLRDGGRLMQVDRGPLSGLHAIALGGSGSPPKISA